ncbi:MAG TPA: ABC transporter ATP-binding protein [Saprospiraceae bacterium]|nr:ABC transporter ATP-binding protein [Saprospiraceae bacterium]HNT21229.1 ABC transporter ATP-binding protein [Saprospiraceae bacterium]
MEVRIDRLSKRYQHGWVFRDLTHDFRNHQCYGIAGRNGSGKSTFLKIISGLLSATRGEVNYHLGGQTVSRENIYQEVNVAAPYTDLIEEFTLREMVRFHCRFKPLSVDRAEDWIEMTGLSRAADRPLAFYSSGMKQKVKLALAMYSRGSLLLLDEPTSNLDDNARSWFFDHLEKQKGNKTVFIASNEAEDFRMCEEVIRLDATTP